MNRALEVYRGAERYPHSLVPVGPEHSDAGSDRLDLKALWFMLRRRIRVFLSVLTLALVLAVLITLYQKPKFTAGSQVALNTSVEQVAPTTDNDGTRTLLPNDFVANTEVQVIWSRQMAARVAEALNLYNDPNFNPLLDTTLGLRGRFLTWLGLWDDKPRKQPTADDSRRAVLDRLQASLNVLRIGTSLALSITYEADDANYAARIANEYARQYTLGQLGSKQESNREARAFLDRRLEDVRQQAKADNERVQKYRIASNLLSTSGASLTEQEISSYNQQVASARAQAAEDEARLNTARAQLHAGSTGDDVGEALGSSVVSALRSRQAETAAELASLQSRYGPLHPDVLRAKSALEDINTAIQAEIQRVISNLEARAQVSKERLASLSRTLAAARGALADNNRAMVSLDDLIRRADASQQLYESYLSRYKEMSASEGAERPDARIISYAEVPLFPSSPNVVLNIALALILGGGLGLGAALLSELSFSGLTTGDEVESRLHVRHLASIPAARTVWPRSKTPISAVIEHPKSAFSEAFRNLRTSIDYASPRRVQVVTVTSALPQEGKTTIATCLARVVALSGERVVLVDCDLRRRGLGRYLRDTESRPGLIKVLKGEVSLDDALVRDPESGAFLLLVTMRDPEASELLCGNAMDTLLDKLRQKFNYIVLDAPPVLAIAEARVLASKADATIFVARWRKTADHALKAALRLLPQDHVSLAGIVLSRVNMRKQARFGYGDSGFYYNKYKGYYG